MIAASVTFGPLQHNPSTPSFWLFCLLVFALFVYSVLSWNISFNLCYKILLKTLLLNHIATYDEDAALYLLNSLLLLKHKDSVCLLFVLLRTPSHYCTLRTWSKCELYSAATANAQTMDPHPSGLSGLRSNLSRPAEPGRLLSHSTGAFTTAPLSPPNLLITANCRLNLACY